MRRFCGNPRVSPAALAAGLWIAATVGCGSSKTGPVNPSASESPQSTAREVPANPAAKEDLSDPAPAKPPPAAIPEIDPARRAAAEVGLTDIHAVVTHSADCLGCECVEVRRFDRTEDGLNAMKEWLRREGRVDPAKTLLLRSAGVVIESDSLASVRKALGLGDEEAATSLIGDDAIATGFAVKALQDRLAREDRKEPGESLLLATSGRRAIIGFYKEGLEGSFTSFVIPLNDVFDAAAGAPSAEEGVAKAVVALERLRGQIATWNRRNGEVRERRFVYLAGDVAEEFTTSEVGSDSKPSTAAVAPELLTKLLPSGGSVTSERSTGRTAYVALVKVLNLAAADRSVQIPCHGGATLIAAFLNEQASKSPARVGDAQDKNN